MFNAASRKLLYTAPTYFLGTGAAGVLPTDAPVCMGASGMGTSLKSSWPIALIVYESVAYGQRLGRFCNTRQLSHTDATDEAEKDHSSQYIPDEVGLAGAVESGGRAVLLVVVRRLGHAAGRISI